MRTARLALALLMLLASVPADAARVLVIADHGGSAHAKSIITILNLINPGGYDVMSPCAPELNTERLRTGVLPSGTYGAVIYTALGATDCGARDNSHSDYMLDSLKTTDKAPLIPHLWVGDQSGYIRSDWDSMGIGTPDLTTKPGGLTYRLPGTSYTFATNMSEGATVEPGEIPPGGIRKYISRTTNARNRYAAGSVFPCGDCDSSGTVLASATTDSVLMWSKLNAHKAGAKPIICVIPADFAGGDVEYSPEVMLMALAALDSLSGHAVFGENPRPIQWGFVVRGAFSRMTHASSGGFPPQDTSTVYASIDSLASLRVPFSVAANVCSVATYPRDKQVWARASMAHYTPYITNGAIDSTAQNQGASYNVPVDPFGRWRSRAAYGDGSRAGKDTSLTALLVAARFKADSLWPGRVDHLLIAPWDDWSPVNTPAMTLDSLFGAFRKAGFVGVVSNMRLRNSNPTAVGGANPYGWWPQQRWEYTSKISAGRFKILATPGWQDSGSARWDNGSGSAGAYVYPSFDRMEMFWRGLLMGATMPGRSSGQYHTKRPDSTDGATRIYTIHVGDLGKGTHASGRATRPGWWQIKYIVNASKAINYLAGRTLIDIRYPEDVEP